MNTPTPTPHNLLELYRAHHDEIDALTDPVSFFILGFINHAGKVTLDELTRDVNLSLSELRVKLVPLLRGKLIHDAKGILTITPLGAQVLGELGFPTQAIPASNQARNPTQQPVRTANSNWQFATPKASPPVTKPPFNWGALIGIAATIILLTIVGGGTWLLTLAPTPTPTFTATASPTFTNTPSPTSTPSPNIVVPGIVSPTPTASSTPSPARTLTPSLTPSRTLTPTRTPTVTRTAQPVTINLAPNEDAYVTSACSPTGVNNTDRLYVASNGGDPDCPSARQRALLHFDLKLPANAIVTQAKLNMHVIAGMAGTTRIGVHRVTDKWSQTSVTWNNQPGRTAMYDNVNVGGEGWYTWDVVKMVDEWQTGTQPNFGLALVNTSENVDTSNFRSFNSGEFLNRALRPYLQITYQLK